MEVASSDDVGLVEVLDRFGRGLTCSFLYVARRCFHKTSRGEILRLVTARVKTIDDDMMADLLDRMLVDVSSYGRHVRPEIGGIYVSWLIQWLILASSSVKEPAPAVRQYNGRTTYVTYPYRPLP